MKVAQMFYINFNNLETVHVQTKRANQELSKLII